MKTKSKRSYAIVFAQSLCLIALWAMSFGVQAARPGSEGKLLAQEAVALTKKMELIVFDGRGLKGATASLYYQGFENPLQDHLKRWPTNFDPESNSWGDYLYCRDAVSSLILIGMSQNQGNLAQQSDRKIADYRRTRNKCYEAAKKSPDQVR